VLDNEHEEHAWRQGSGRALRRCCSSSKLRFTLPWAEDLTIVRLTSTERSPRPMEATEGPLGEPSNEREFTQMQSKPNARELANILAIHLSFVVLVAGGGR
jgi:hypothetical protein